MTNQEKLATVTPEEWLIKVDWLFHVYGKRWDNSYLAIKEWLAEEATADKHEQVVGQAYSPDGQVQPAQEEAVQKIQIPQKGGSL